MRYNNNNNKFIQYRSKGGAVARALASHQCGPGSNPGVDVICGSKLLLVLSLAPRGFSPGLRFSPRSGMHRHVSTSSYKLLSAPWVNKLQLQLQLQLQYHHFCTGVTD